MYQVPAIVSVWRELVEGAVMLPLRRKDSFIQTHGVEGFLYDKQITERMIFTLGARLGPTREVIP